MSLRSSILALVDIVLRVPPLFIIDGLFRINLGYYDSTQDIEKTVSIIENSSLSNKLFNETLMSDNVEYDNIFYSKNFYLNLLKCCSSLLGCSAALCIFSLGTKQLVVVYMYIISVGIVFVSYWANVSTMKIVMMMTQGCILEDILSLNKELLSDGTFISLAQNYVVQIVLAYTFSYIHLGPRYSVLNRLLPLSFLAPSMLAILPLPTSVLCHAPVFSALLPLAMVKFVLWCSAYSILHTLYSGFQHAKNFICNFGLSALLETEWVRLNIPSVLRVFWMLRVAEQASTLAYSGWDLAEAPIPFLLSSTKSLLISGCETVTAVLGMTAVVSRVCHYLGCFFQWVLMAEDDDERSIGSVSAVLFYILALQTGLTGLESEKRFARLCRNVCLLFTALLHFIHNMVNPLLMSLSASHNPCVYRHIRALFVCLFLILYPVTLMSFLWTHQALSTWLLAVTAFSLEVIVKVIISLMIYSLFLMDAYRTSFWEKLDDYVYYIKALGNSIEFCFGIFLFLNGAWIFVYESGGAIRAGMMCIHAYFNIWSEARAGWNVFMKRRTAVNKIESLPEASSAQLSRLDDVCAICYQEMDTAKITRCNHYFHGVCLRKWLYVQDRCPLCHEILYRVDMDAETKQEDDGRGLLLIPPLPEDDGTHR